MWILKSLSLKAKISYLVVASCIISAFAVFLISTSIARKELVKASQNQLESIASLAQEGYLGYHGIRRCPTERETPGVQGTPGPGYSHLW